MDFFFTYGTGQQFPFKGGWTIVKSPSREMAVKEFHYWHPDVNPGIINCSEVYDMDSFISTDMPKKGNFGYGCQEVLVADERGVGFFDYEP